MGSYLINNNVISKYFSGLFTEEMAVFISEIIDETPIISVITEIEALSWVSIDKNKEKIIKEFIFDLKILNLNPEIVLLCVKIRRSKKIKTPDAIIAATAIFYDLILLTNDKDFEGIQNLKLLNPSNSLN
jgi:predicted nucleic acid-binding protein